MSEHRQKLLQDWTMADWQDEAKAQREARETAERQLREARTQVERQQDFIDAAADYFTHRPIDCEWARQDCIDKLRALSQPTSPNT